MTDEQLDEPCDGKHDNDNDCLNPMWAGERWFCPTKSLNTLLQDVAEQYQASRRHNDAQ